MKYLRFAGRIIRRLVWETLMDDTTGLAAQMAYQSLIALAPGLLFLWHLLGLFGTDPSKLHQMLGILKSFLPSDPKVQEILDTQAASVSRISCTFGSEGRKLFKIPSIWCRDRKSTRLNSSHLRIS